MIPMAMPARGWYQGRQTVEEFQRCEEERRLPQGSRLGESVDHVLTARCPRRTLHPGRAQQGHSLGLAFESLRVAGLDADPGVQGEACPEFVEGPPLWCHWRISTLASGGMRPGRVKNGSSNTIPHCFIGSSYRPAPPLTRTIMVLDMVSRPGTNQARSRPL